MESRQTAAASASALPSAGVMPGMLESPRLFRFNTERSGCVEMGVAYRHAARTAREITASRGLFVALARNPLVM